MPYDPANPNRAIFQVVGGIQTTDETGGGASSQHGRTFEDGNKIESDYDLEGIFGRGKYLFLQHGTTAKTPQPVADALGDLDTIADTANRVAMTPAERTQLSVLAARKFGRHLGIHRFDGIADFSPSPAEFPDPAEYDTAEITVFEQPVAAGGTPQFTEQWYHDGANWLLTASGPAGGGSADESTIGTAKPDQNVHPAADDAEFSEGDTYMFVPERIVYRRLADGTSTRNSIRSFQRDGNASPDFPPTPFVGQWHETLDGRSFHHSLAGWELQEEGVPITLTDCFDTLPDLLNANPASVAGVVYVKNHNYLVPDTCPPEIAGTTRRFRGGMFYKVAAETTNGITTWQSSDAGASYRRDFDGENVYVEWARLGDREEAGEFDFPNSEQGIFCDGSAIQVASDLITDGTIHFPYRKTLIQCRQDVMVDKGTTIEGNFSTWKRADLPSTVTTAVAPVGSTTVTVDDASEFWVGAKIWMSSSPSHADAAFDQAGGTTITALTANTITFGLPTKAAMPVGASVFITTRQLACRSPAGETLTGWCNNIIFDGNVDSIAPNFSWFVYQTVNFGSMFNLRMRNCEFRNYPSDAVIHGYGPHTYGCKWINGGGAALHGSAPLSDRKDRQPGFHQNIEIENICQATGAENGHGQQYGFYTQSAGVHHQLFDGGSVNNLNNGYIATFGSDSDNMQFRGLDFHDAGGWIYHSGIAAGESIDNLQFRDCNFYRCGGGALGTASNDFTQFKGTVLENCYFEDTYVRIHNQDGILINNVKFVITENFFDEFDKIGFTDPINAVLSLGGVNCCIKDLTVENRGADASDARIRQGLILNQGTSNYIAEMDFQDLVTKGFYRNVDYNSAPSEPRKIKINGWVSVVDTTVTGLAFSAKWGGRFCCQAEIRNAKVTSLETYSGIQLTGNGDDTADGCTVTHSEIRGSSRGIRASGRNNRASQCVWEGAPGYTGGSNASQHQLINGTNVQYDPANRTHTIV